MPLKIWLQKPVIDDGKKINDNFGIYIPQKVSPDIGNSTF
jgi:hypothetical protein